MNNEKLGAAPQMYVGRDAKQAIEIAWPKKYIISKSRTSTSRVQ